MIGRPNVGVKHGVRLRLGVSLRGSAAPAGQRVSDERLVASPCEDCTADSVVRVAGCCQAAWLQCRLAATPIAKESDRRRPIAALRASFFNVCKM